MSCSLRSYDLSISMATSIIPLQVHHSNTSIYPFYRNHHCNHQTRLFISLLSSPKIYSLSNSLNISAITHFSPTKSLPNFKPQPCFAAQTTALCLLEARGDTENVDRKSRAEDFANKIRAIPAPERFKYVHFTTFKVGLCRNLEFVNDMIMGLVFAEEFDIALKLFDEMPLHGLSPDSWTYSIVIRCYCRKLDPDEGKKVLDLMVEKGFRPSVVTLTILVNSFCSRGKIQRALEVVEMMGTLGCNPNVHTYNCVLKGLCFVGRVEEAYEMLMNLKNDEKCDLDVYSFTTVMDGFCKVGRSDEAIELLEEAIKIGLSPNVVTYNTLFNGFCKEGKPRKGIRLMKQMKERDCLPDHISYSTLLHGLLKWGKVKAAYWIYKDMVEVGFKVDERMMNTLLRGLCKESWTEEGLVKNVHQILDTMKKCSCTIYPATYYLVSHTLCIAKEVDMAMAILIEMIEAGYFPRMVTVNRIIRELCEEERISEALSVLVLVCRTGIIPSKISYNLLIDEFNRQRNMLGACSVYGAALKLGVVPHQRPFCVQVI